MDLEHYWQSCIIKPVSKFFRHIIAPKIYPPVFETLTIQEQNKIQAFRQVVKNRQFQEVNTFLFEPLNKILLKRCEMDMRSANHIQTITSLITKSHTLECEYCNSFFDTLEPTQKICIACTKNYTDIVSTLKRKLKTVHQELEKNKAICHECVALTGFPLMDIETCTKYDCEIYETKSRLNIDKKQFEKKLEILSHITIEYEDSMQVDDEEEEEEKPQESKRFKPSTD